MKISVHLNTVKYKTIIEIVCFKLIIKCRMRWSDTEMENDLQTTFQVILNIKS